MRVQTFDKGAAFLEAAGSWLYERVAENNLVIGIATTDRNQPGAYCADPWFAVVWNGDIPVMAALRTPPRPMVLSRGDLTALPALCKIAREHHPDNPGFIGPREEAETMARAWAGEAWHEAMAMRTYELTRVLPDERRPAGTLRLVRTDERALLEDWILAFRRDAHLRDPTPVTEMAQRMMAGARAWFWDVGGQPVATVAGSADLEAAARVGMVYTPPELRGRGYGSAATAALSQRLLDQGVRACFLFTDLANPTSNAIYQRIGYESRGDYCDLLLD